MQRKKYRITALLACLFLLLTGISAQYKVTGGSKTPLLAVDDTRNRIQVYLVYGTDGVEISYTSASASHQWYRYQTRALDAEKTTASQQGTTSMIRGVEDGYGYYVQTEGQLTTYIWIIDYSRHAFNITSLQASGGNNPCSTFRLTGATTLDALSYQTPNGVATPVDRTFDVTYTSLKWDEQQRSFSREEVARTVTGDPFAFTYKAPLCDTPVRLSGDSFARYFGVEKSALSDEYQAVALEVHADTTLLSADVSGASGESGELSAPAQIRFAAYANDPVAAIYIWKIYKKSTDSSEDELLLRFTSEEIEYEFTQAGSYYAELEVSDRSKTCSDASNRFDLTISEYTITIPNAFSPGTTPGINDEFRITYKSIYNFKGWIFNRWGSELFYWTDPSQGWDGKSGGKYVTPGVYFYVMEFEGSDGKKHKKSGDINILRSKTTE